MGFVKSSTQIAKLFRILSFAIGVKRTFVIITVYTFLSTLDLIGVLAFGLIASEVISGISPSFNSNATNSVLKYLSLENTSLQLRVAMLTSGAILLMIIKTILLFFVQKRIYNFLAYKSAALTAYILQELLNRDKNRTSSISNDMYTATTGVQNIFSHIVSNILTVVADIIVSASLMLTLFVIDPLVAMFTVLAFAFLGILLTYFSGERVRENGRTIGRLVRKSNQEVMETILAFREIKLRNAGQSYVSKISNTRTLIGMRMVQQQIYPNISKYIFESFILVLLAVVAALSLTRFDSKVTFENLAMFLIASSRIGPAVMRIQLSWMQAKNGLAQSEETIIALRNFDDKKDQISVNEITSFDHLGFEPSLKITNLNFRFSEDNSELNNWELKLSSLELKSGSRLHILGESGSGKSTFADILLGFREPDSGEVLISNLPVLAAREQWPGAIAYVPQEIPLINASVRDNILLGVESNLVPHEWLEDLLSITQLSEWIAGLPEKLETKLGENGVTPSGGQRQRIGLARALLTKPRLILLDESTSGLDLATEELIIKRLDALPWSCTQIIITHRLNLVNKADSVITIARDGSIQKSKATTGTLEP